MLRVGLTGGLGSGKTTVARLFADLGVHVLEADRIGRELMQPGQPVYSAIVEHFGGGILQPGGQLDRAALARIVFGSETAPSRLRELNRIVHPAVIAEQERRMNDLAATDPGGIAMVESALIFEVERDSALEVERDSAHSPESPGWTRRFDKIILVTAPDALKVARFVGRTMRERAASGRPAQPAQRTMLEQDARNRLAAQIPDSEKIARSDYVIDNSGNLESLAASVRRIFAEIQPLALRSGW